MILFNTKTLLVCFIAIFYILLKNNNIRQKGEKYYKNQYLILFSQDIINKQEVLNLFDLHITQDLGEWILANKKNTISYAVSLDDETTKLEQGFIEQLQEHPLIHSASLNFVDPDDSCQFCTNDKINNSNNLAWHLTKEYGINIIQAWDITQGDKNNVLAIVDRNFVFPQIFLCQNKSYYHQNMLDFVNSSIKDKDNTPHGLEILSVLGCNAQEKILGIDLKTSLMAVDSQFDKSLSTRMLGILWAAGLAKNLKPNLHPAKVINASFGFIVNDTKNMPFGPVLDTITDLNNHNVTLIASAGNESSLADNRLPGSLAGVISVGASNKYQQSAYFSNFGKTVDILAPGEDIIGFNEHLLPTLLDGTSFAAPIAASVVSLLLAINADFSWKHIEYLLQNSSKKISCNNYCPNTMPYNSLINCQKNCCNNETNVCAAGIIDAYNAVTLAMNEKFNHVLLDVDDYFIPLDNTNKFSKTITVKNWGFIGGLVKFSSDNPNIYAYPSEFYIDAAKNLHNPAIQKITVHSAIPKWSQKNNIIFTAINDDIQAMVSLDPS